MLVKYINILSERVKLLFILQRILIDIFAITQRFLRNLQEKKIAIYELLFYVNCRLDETGVQSS